MQYQDMADLIGAESCVDFSPDAPATLPAGGGAGSRPPRWQKRTNADYPPAIPSLTKTTKYTTADGRLVIKEEYRREYMLVHRSDGRVVLNLIPLDGDGCDEEVEEKGEETDAGNGVASTVHSEKGKGEKDYGGFAAAVAAAVAELRPPVLTGETF